MSFEQSTVGRERLRLVGGSTEPLVSADQLLAAVGSDVERFRALLPVGYATGVAAYRQSVAELTARDLTEHYTDGLTFFHDQFVPYLKQTLMALSGGAWCLDDYVAYAAGSDVDFMTHVIDGLATSERVALFPGDWHGFRVGASRQESIVWDADAKAGLACLCVPSVRNGHVTDEMIDFLTRADNCLLNLNLFPTLVAAERKETARQLAPLLEKSILSISFSRGFGLTASQLGVAFVHRDHPLRRRFHEQWQWFTYFYNAIAARAFMLIDPMELERVDGQRRQWVHDWLQTHKLPVVTTGSYYVKSFRVADLPTSLNALSRDNIVRLCFKPPIA